MFTSRCTEDRRTYRHLQTPRPWLQLQYGFSLIGVSMSSTCPACTASINFNAMRLPPSQRASSRNLSCNARPSRVVFISLGRSIGCHLRILDDIHAGTDFCFPSRDSSSSVASLLDRKGFWCDLAYRHAQPCCRTSINKAAGWTCQQLHAVI